MRTKEPRTATVHQQNFPLQVYNARPCKRDSNTHTVHIIACFCIFVSWASCIYLCKFNDHVREGLILVLQRQIFFPTTIELSFYNGQISFLLWLGLKKRFFVHLQVLGERLPSEMIWWLWDIRTSLAAFCSRKKPLQKNWTFWLLPSPTHWYQAAVSHNATLALLWNQIIVNLVERSEDYWLRNAVFE